MVYDRKLPLIMPLNCPNSQKSVPTWTKVSAMTDGFRLSNSTAKALDHSCDMSDCSVNLLSQPAQFCF